MRTGRKSADHENMKKPMHPENDSATTFTCSMHPEVVTDQPGRCPTCGMELIRVKEDSHE